MAQHLLARSAQLFHDMLADRRARAAARPADNLTADKVLAEIEARLAQPARELPSLVGAFAYREAVFGPHGAQVAA